MNLSRRSFLAGTLALAAPAIILMPGLLMPVSALAQGRAFYAGDLVWYDGARREWRKAVSDDIWFNSRPHIGGSYIRA